MKDVIVSLSSKGRENYNGQLLRLIDSVKQHWPGDMLVYSPDHWLEEYKGVKINRGWPQPKGLKNYTHSEMPYQFKTSMIQLALEMGYERIIWLDSSMQLKKDLTPLFDNDTGITTFENLGHPTWKYLSQAAEDLLKKTFHLPSPDIAPHFDHVKDIPQIWGGAFALDFTRTVFNVRNAFGYLKEFSTSGVFKDGPGRWPGFVAHRHDQSVMSVLFYKHCTMLPYGNILCPPHDITGEYGTDPYLICRGL